MKENKQGYGEQGPLLLRKKYPLLPHLREEGLQAIVNIRASLNLGLSEVLKVAFPDTIAVDRPRILSQVIPHPE